MDAEARLQAAIAMTQLSTTQPVNNSDHGQCRHLATGATCRQQDENSTRGRSKFGDQRRRNGCPMEAGSNGAANPETGEVRSAPDLCDSTLPCLSVQTGSGSRITWDLCDANRRVAEDGKSLSKPCDYGGKKKHEASGHNSVPVGTRSQCNTEGEKTTPGVYLSQFGTGAEKIPWVVPLPVPATSLDQSSFSDGRYLKGKFVRTAQASGPSAAVRIGKNSDNATGKFDTNLTLSSEDTPVVKRRPRGGLDVRRPLKRPRQQRLSKNQPVQTFEGKGESVPNVRHKYTETDATPAVTRGSKRGLDRATVPDRGVRGMVFSFNPNGGVLIPLAPIAPIPTTIVEAERNILAWMHSDVGSASHDLSSASESVPFGTLSSYSSSRLNDLKPHVPCASQSLLPASVSSSEDFDTMISSAADAAARSSNSKSSSRRRKPCRILSGKSEGVCSGTHSSHETFQCPAFKVEEKTEVDDPRSCRAVDTERVSLAFPIKECDQQNRIARRFEPECNECVDLSTKKTDNRTGETPKTGDTSKTGDTPASEIKTELKPFAEPETDVWSATSPLDLTTHSSTYGSLGSLKSYYALSGLTPDKLEKHAIFMDSRNSRDEILLHEIQSSAPIDYDVNQALSDVPRTKGLAQSIRHGSVADNDLKGTCLGPVRSTSSMIAEKKSPSADDPHPTQIPPTCGLVKDAVSGSLETKMNLAQSGAQLCRSKRTEGPLLPRSVLDLPSSDAEDAVALTTTNPSTTRGQDRVAVALEEMGSSDLPGSQCSYNPPVASSQEDCRLPPKKRRINQTPQHNSVDLDFPNGQDLTNPSRKEEIPGRVSHLEQAVSNNNQRTLFASPRHGGAALANRLHEPISAAVEIIVKLKFRNDDDIDSGRQEYGSDGMSVFATSSYSTSRSSTPLPHRTSSDCSALQPAIQPDEDGDLPLHVAVAQGLQPVVDSLVSVMSQLDTTIDAFNRNRQTPLHVAVITNQREIVRKLLQAGACPNKSDRKGHNSVHLAVNNRCHECLRILLSHSKYPVEVNAMNYEGLMPLHLAVQLGDVHSVEALLSFGAQVNGVDGKNGRTALYYAAERSDLGSAELLLKTGASPAIASYSGCLPVNAARANGAMVKLLERYSSGGDTLMGSERAAAAGGGVAMTTAKTGGRESKRRESKQVKSKE